MNIVLELLKSVLFGIVQGITEWLPISSTGHMILLDELVHLNCTPAFWNTFLVVIQLGSILAVVVLYFHRLNPFSPKKDRNEKIDTISLWLKIAVAAIPAGILGILFDEAVERISTPTVVAAALIVYGVAFLVLESRHARPRIDSMDHLNYKTAFFIGVFQCLSLVPGTSRSGSTSLGASILGCAFSGAEWAVLLTGAAVAFLVSLFAIRFLLSYIRKHDFKAFGWYRIVLGLLVLGYFFLLK